MSYRKCRVTGSPSPVQQDISGMANKNNNPFLQYVPGYMQAQAAMQQQAQAMSTPEFMLQQAQQAPQEEKKDPRGGCRPCRHCDQPCKGEEHPKHPKTCALYCKTTSRVYKCGTPMAYDTWVAQEDAKEGREYKGGRPAKGAEKKAEAKAAGKKPAGKKGAKAAAPAL